MYIIWYDCPKCGKKKCSPDGYTFCGKCEVEYQRDKATQE